MSPGILSSLSIRKINSITNSFSLLQYIAVLEFELEDISRFSGLPQAGLLLRIMNGWRFIAEIRQNLNQDPGWWVSYKNVIHSAALAALWSLQLSVTATGSAFFPCSQSDIVTVKRWTKHEWWFFDNEQDGWVYSRRAWVLFQILRVQQVHQSFNKLQGIGIGLFVSASKKIEKLWFSVGCMIHYKP